MARIICYARIMTAWRNVRFWFQSLVPQPCCGCRLVVSLAITESSVTWRKNLAN